MECYSKRILECKILFFEYKVLGLKGFGTAMSECIRPVQIVFIAYNKSLLTAGDNSCDVAEPFLILLPKVLCPDRSSRMRASFFFEFPRDVIPESQRKHHTIDGRKVDSFDKFRANKWRMAYLMPIRCGHNL